ncbi:hypothetical protein GOP47_0022597 [Adiantum capillus-veneris]|uniref:RRM domain-containing protein n=1 Tax=Adiantum capillus-veneris TaxID=13818 RepID=A0A9D4U6T0_ADICA|nr:hypothetical protein GOP47_0022597 [Adiantum capillus-veneris]
MTGQAEDKESSPETTVEEVSEPTLKEKEVFEPTPKVSTPDAKEEDHPTSEKPFHRNDEQEAPSRHLWVGNVSTSVTEAELAEQFSRFGDIESVTAYPSRNYAFVNFKSVEDGLYAKKGLQATVLGGLAIRIEFAKGAKPSKHLWIGNISNSVTKEQLEAECKRFGVVDDVRILRERNCAFVDFAKTDDAVAAFENLNKKLFGNDELCVEYVKSQQHQKKDSRSDGQPRSDERSTLHDEAVKAISEKPKRDRDDPSEILWVGFPICMKIDERKLHKAFSPFGGIERITTFPGRTYAFVQFHSVKAATRAKNVLQGKLFNDPRVSISFAKSEIGPVDHHGREAGSWMSSPASNANLPPLLFSKPPGFPNPRNDRFLGFNNFRPHSPPGFRRRPEGDMEDPNMFFQGSHLEGGFRDDMVRGMRPGPDINLWGSPALPEGAFIHPRHVSHMQQERWNFEEEALIRRDTKRPRGPGNFPAARGGLMELRSPDKDDRDAFHIVKAQDYISRFTRNSNLAPENWEDPEGLKRPAKRPALGSDMDVGRSPKDSWTMPTSHSKEGFQWQGVIAKSGTSVCRARCYSMGQTINFVFPEVVNCTARTSLDMLAKHISEVGDFSLVSFVPHGDLDVEPYQEFIVYLSEKNRAAVCKLSQESTLFLVPPSSFVEHFLKAPNENKIIDGYQKSASQASLEQKLPTVTHMQASPFHGMAGADVPLLPPRSSVPASSSAIPSYSSSIGISTTGGLSGNLVMANNSLSHGSVIDDSQLGQMHLPPGYASMQQQQQQNSAPQLGSFSLTPSTTDLNLHQEHGVRIIPPLPISTTSQPSSTSGQYPPSQMQTSQIKNVAQTSTPYLQQPPLPQYPHPSTQQKQPFQPAQISLPSPLPMQADHFAQLASMVTSQVQPFGENVQAAMQSQPPLGSQVHQHQVGVAPMSNFAPIKEQWSASQPSQLPPSQKDDNRGQTAAVDAEQRELLQLAQQKLSEAKGESGEDNKRFQATLELAAALLQQLQQRAK